MRYLAALGGILLALATPAAAQFPSPTYNSLTVNGAAALGGTSTLGLGANNILTLTPGAASTNPFVFSLSGTGGFQFGNGTAPITITNGNIAVASGQNLLISLGGSTHTLTFAGTGGTGNPAILTASSTLPMLDLQSGNTPGTTLKTAWNLVNPSQAQATLSGVYSNTKSPLAMQFQPSGTVTPTGGGYQYMLWNTPSDTVQGGTNTAISMLTLINNAGCNPVTATATGTISGTTLTVSGVTGAIAAGQTGWGTGVISFNITGGSGTTWTINQSQSVGPVSMSFCVSYTGFRTAVAFKEVQIAPSANGFGTAVFQGGQASSDVAYNEGGTALTVAGASASTYAWPEACRMHAGATNFFANKCKETDIAIETGASALNNAGVDYVLLSTTGVQGTYTDHAIGITAQNGAGVGFKTFIEAGRFDSQDPGGSNTTVFGWNVGSNPSLKNPSALAGINLTVPKITGCAYSSDGFCMSTSGGMSIYQGLISQISTGIQIDVPNYKLTPSTISSGGSGITAGDWFQDATSGTTVQCNTSPSGACTAITTEHVGYQSTTASTLTVTNMNPDRTAQTFVINVTAALNNGLTLVGSSNKLAFYGAAPIVKATPSGACAGNTGCQALRDAMGNLGLINTGSISN